MSAVVGFGAPFGIAGRFLIRRLVRTEYRHLTFHSMANVQELKRLWRSPVAEMEGRLHVGLGTPATCRHCRVSSQLQWRGQASVQNQIEPNFILYPFFKVMNLRPLLVSIGYDLEWGIGPHGRHHEKYKFLA